MLYSVNWHKLRGIQQYNFIWKNPTSTPRGCHAKTITPMSEPASFIALVACLRADNPTRAPGNFAWATRRSSAFADEARRCRPLVSPIALYVRALTRTKPAKPTFGHLAHTFEWMLSLAFCVTPPRQRRSRSLWPRRVYIGFTHAATSGQRGELTCWQWGPGITCVPANIHWPVQGGSPQSCRTTCTMQWPVVRSIAQNTQCPSPLAAVVFPVKEFRFVYLHYDRVSVRVHSAELDRVASNILGTNIVNEVPPVNQGVPLEAELPERWLHRYLNGPVVQDAEDVLQLEVRPLEKCRGADVANSAATRTSPPAPIHVVCTDDSDVRCAVDLGGRATPSPAAATWTLAGRFVKSLRDVPTCRFSFRFARIHMHSTFWVWMSGGQSSARGSRRRASKCLRLVDWCRRTPPSRRTCVPGNIHCCTRATRVAAVLSCTTCTMQWPVARSMAPNTQCPSLHWPRFYFWLKNFDSSISTMIGSPFASIPPSWIGWRRTSSEQTSRTKFPQSTRVCHVRPSCQSVECIGTSMDQWYMMHRMSFSWRCDRSKNVEVRMLRTAPQPGHRHRHPSTLSRAISVYARLHWPQWCSLGSKPRAASHSTTGRALTAAKTGTNWYSPSSSNSKYCLPRNYQLQRKSPSSHERDRDGEQ